MNPNDQDESSQQRKRPITRAFDREEIRQVKEASRQADTERRRQITVAFDQEEIAKIKKASSRTGKKEIKYRKQNDEL